VDCATAEPTFQTIDTSRADRPGQPKQVPDLTISTHG
jgi:hypothetical protein